jgi:hypothetical protein
MRDVFCDKFTDMQFVPAKLRRGVYAVTIRPYGAGGDGQERCLVYDVMAGTEEMITLRALLRRNLCFPNGRPLRKAWGLVGGRAYTFFDRQPREGYGVFVVPKSSKYRFVGQGRVLNAGECIVRGGVKDEIMNLSCFRRMFIMAPNAVAEGALSCGYADVYSGSNLGSPQLYDMSGGGSSGNSEAFYPEAHQGLQTGYENQYDAAAYSPQVPQVPPSNPQTPMIYNPDGDLLAVGRLFRNEVLLGLVLSDGQSEKNCLYANAVALAKEGRIRNLGIEYLHGAETLAGLEALPYRN